MTKIIQPPGVTTVTLNPTNKRLTVSTLPGARGFASALAWAAHSFRHNSSSSLIFHWIVMNIQCNLFSLARDGNMETVTILLKPPPVSMEVGSSSAVCLLTPLTTHVLHTHILVDL